MADEPVVVENPEGLNWKDRRITMIRKKLVKATMYALLPAAVALNLAVMAAEAAWDAYWELVDIVSSGRRP